jgi:hypothetical protein
MNKFFARQAAKAALVKFGSVAGVLAAMGTSAHAALPTEVTDAIETAGTDMVTAVTAIIVAFVAFWGLKKLGAKLGWI